jgi:inorganic pyrophosphatase
MAAQGYSIKESGKPDTLDYRVYFFRNNGAISPFHDIPLWADKSKNIANMVVEIPKGTQPKLEISKDVYLNPIKQDVKNGKLRYVAWKYPFNYGALPQTWENPAFVHPDTKAKGDNDPVDAVELSSAPAKTGDIKQVKILGTYAMIDEGETDWKVVCIDVHDPLADKLNDVDDIEKNMPGKLKEVFEFLRDYKIPDGKPANQFAFDGKLKDKKFALEVVDETYREWQALLADGNAKIQNFNTTNEKSPRFVSSAEAEKNLKF